MENKKIFYWKWAVGAMQIMHMLQQMDRHIQKSLDKPTNERTTADDTFLTGLYISREEIASQASIHADRLHRRQTLFDKFIISIYRWTQGIPKDMDIKLTVQDLS